MPECIVCKGYYETGQRCERCGSDNAPWDHWRATHVEEQEGIEGLLAFIAPHLYLPFFITILALAFGLMGIGRLWKGITPAAQLLAVALTVCGCIILTFAGYGARHDIREQELLKRVRRGSSALLGSIQFRAIIVPAFSILLVLLITYTMITSDLSWKLARLFFLDPAYLEEIEQQEAVSETTPEEGQPEEPEKETEEPEQEETEEPEEEQHEEAEEAEEGEGGELEEEETEKLRERIRQVLPFALISMYVAFMISLTYSASLLLALVYAKKMNEALPQPIFLQGNHLAEMVRTQAEEQLNREAGFAVQTTRTIDKGTGEATGTIFGMFNRLLPAPDPTRHEEKQTARLRREQEQTLKSGIWNWEELERTKDGGIMMRASGRQYVQALGTPTGLDKQQGLRVVYTVTADHWGQITKITRTVGDAPKRQS